MANDRFSISDALKYGWEAFKKHGGGMECLQLWVNLPASLKEQLHGGVLSFHKISQAYPGAPMLSMRTDELLV